MDISDNDRDAGIHIFAFFLHCSQFLFGNEFYRLNAVYFTIRCGKGNATGDSVPDCGYLPISRLLDYFGICRLTERSKWKNSDILQVCPHSNSIPKFVRAAGCVRLCVPTVCSIWKTTKQLSSTMMDAWNAAHVQPTAPQAP